MAPWGWRLLGLYLLAWAPAGGAQLGQRDRKVLSHSSVLASKAAAFGKTLITECDFNNNTRPLCGWTQSKDDDGDWIRTNQPTPTENTGPPGDYPDGKGFYLYLEAGNFSTGQSIKLESPSFSAPSDICVQFYYHMYGIDIDRKTQLNVLVKDSVNQTQVWSAQGPQSSAWLKGSVTVAWHSSGPIQIVFQAVRGDTPYLDTALDNIAITAGPCDPCVQLCDFDTSDDLCGWTTPRNVDDNGWEQWNGPSPNIGDGTGPDNDFSKPGFGLYMLMDSAFGVPGTSVRLESPAEQSYGCLHLSFFYYMYSTSSSSMILNVYAAKPGGPLGDALLSLTGNQGQEWRQADTTYKGTTEVQFIIEGVFGDKRKSDIAVDSVQVSPCEDIFTECDFNKNEKPFCDFIQSKNDNGDWRRSNVSHTGSNNGPPGDYPDAKGYYIYQDANEFGKGASAKLESREICAVTEICIEFNYYMYGLADAELKVLRKSVSGEWPIWSRKGIQSPSWMLGSVTIENGTQQPMQVIFEAVRGATPDMNAALDNISIRKGPCSICLESCDFDTQDDLCGWETPQGAWEQWNGPTDTPGTGPEDDFSKPGLGLYLLMDSMFAKPGVKGLIVSPLYRSTDCLELRFYYYLYGTSSTVTLNVYAAVSDQLLGRPLFTVTGNQGKGWKLAVVRYSGISDIKFIIEGVYGENSLTDIAVDSVSICPCGGGVIPSAAPSTTTIAWNTTITAQSTTATTPKTTVTTTVSSTATTVQQTTTTPILGNTTIPITSTITTITSGSTTTTPKTTTLISMSPTTSITSVNKTTTHTVTTPDTTTLLSPITTTTYAPIINTTSGTTVISPSTTTTKTTPPSSTTLTIPVTPITSSTSATTTGTTTTILASLSSNTTSMSTATTPVTTITITTSTTSPSTTATSGNITIVTSLGTTTNTPLGSTTLTIPPSTTTSSTLATTTGITTAILTSLSSNTTSVTTTPLITTTTTTTSAAPTTTSGNKTTRAPSTTPAGTTTLVSPTTNTTYTPSITTLLTSTTTSGTTVTSVTSPATITTTPPSSTTLTSPVTPMTSSTSATTVPRTTILTSLSSNTTAVITTSLITTTTTTPATTTTSGNITTTAPRTTPAGTTTLLPPITNTTYVSNITTLPTSTTPRGTTVTSPSTTTNTPTSSTPQTIPTTIMTSSTLETTGTTSSTLISLSSNTTSVTTDMTPPGTTTTTTTSPSTTTTTINTIPQGSTTSATPGTTATTTNITATSIVPTTATDSWTTTTVTTGTTATSTVSSTTIPLGSTVNTQTTTPGATTTVTPGSTTLTTTSLTKITTSESTTIVHNITTTSATLRTTITTTSGSTKPTIYSSTTTTPAGVSPTVTPSTSPECPPNSHYNTCAPACPPRCEAPQNNCSLPCHAGCVCDPGFLLQGNKCVPMSQCGCFYNNTYYESGQVIWGEGCSEVCTCLGNYILHCINNSCLPTEYCKEVDGIPSCYPKDSSTCVVSGDPHYTTFDKRKYDFHGNCTYVLSKPCNSSRTPYAVYASNEYRWNTMTVAYIKAIYVHVYGVVVALLKGKIVQVDGATVNIPINPAAGLSVFSSGKYMVVQADFGLVVRYDGNHYSDIKVTSDYKGELCGLCGDYNGAPGNDFKTPEGELVKAINDFGNSWNVHPSCNKTNSTVVPECTADEEEQYKGPGYCGILVDPQGPFSPCHDKINPNNFFKDCVYDLCELGGNQQVLCEALESYVNECQERNVTLRPWRNDTFCPLPCPPDSHYRPCATACPATCLVPQPGPCDSPCVEGCQCDAGFVQSGTQCVSKKDCGCTYNGQQYQPGEVIFSSACKEVCQCLANNNIKCTDISCAPDEYCSNHTGVQGCFPKDSSTCVVSGDPHYTTFDRRKYDFHGNCTYVLSKPCNSSQTPFAVYASNEYRRNTFTVSYLKAVYVHVYGVVVALLKGSIVQVNNATVTIPFNPAPGLSILVSGKYMVVRTNFSLVVRYDGNHYADVKVISDYAGELCGLCGDYDRAPSNDFKTPDGLLVTGVNDFGNSWNVDQRCNSTGSIVVPDCTEAEQESYEGPTYCGILVDPHGPFTPCHNKINPHTFFKDCVYDLCELNGGQKPLCEALESYANECQDRNITLGPWRNKTHCPLTCPPNSHYDACASACPASCLDPRPSACDRPCVEGCKCDNGFVQSGSQCVSKKDCGCTYNGQYYQPGEVIFSDACNEVCQCFANNNIKCTDISCAPDEYCSNHTGVQGCFHKDSSTCIITGDPHYTTYDKRKYDFHGNCTYVLSKPCNSTQTPFAVYASNEYRWNTFTVSYLKAIYVEVYGVVVTLRKDKLVQVNGATVGIPISPVPGVSISFSGKYAVVQADFGLVVRYDGNHYGDVKVTSDYKGELCGLCGDYDGAPGNDFKKPNQELVTGVNDFGNSWNVDPKCNKTESVVVPDCTEEEQESYEGPAYCGILLNPHGPFAPCHTKINPNTFFKDCVYDMCELDGAQKPLCEALESYVNECQERNITLGPWRNETNCSFVCPPNNHYSSCGSACPGTCQHPRPGSCDRPCVEGCFCNPGFVLHGGKCVRERECTCTFRGQQYKPGEVIFSDGCTELCQCLPNYSVECRNNSCAPDEFCSNHAGVQGCFPKDSSTCVVSGDPHYTTFDKRKYDFHGNCTYVLAKPCNSSRTPFAVYAANEHRWGQLSVTYIKAIYVEVYGVVVAILKNSIVQVNGTTVNIPIHPVPELHVSPSGKYVMVQTDFGLVVRYDGNHYADVKVTSDYQAELCGLCGDYDGTPMNDFKTPDSELVTGVNNFGNSWNVHTNCTPTGSIVVPECTADEQESYEGPEYCWILVDPQGPFAVCHEKISPNTFFKDCVYDMCELDGNKQELCKALDSYVNLCQQRNVTIGSWRNDTFCPIRCPPNSQYHPCGSACRPSCARPEPLPCDQPCVEGCHCNAGFILSGGRCVPVDQCGCSYLGNYYQPGEQWYEPGCSQRCTCHGENQTSCEAWQCTDKEFCGILNGVYGCHPTAEASCYVAGDPHYISFDGRMLSFMGTCTYTLARACRNYTGPWFSIEGKNEDRGQVGGSYLRKIYITLDKNVTITLMKSRRTLINDKRVTLPNSPSSSATITQSGQYVVLQTTFGLTVRWDGNHYLEIIMPNSYYGQVCGLCGNYDGIISNDNLKPDGTATDNSDELGNSWKTADDEEDVCKDDKDPEPPCNKDLLDKVSNSDNCGMITDPLGVFRDCINIVSPLQYFNSCVYDMCRFDGLQQALCDQLQAYTDACLSAGAVVHHWRTPTFCPLDCPPNSNYTLCASSCPPTCNDRFSPANCPGRCVEGCECLPGFVLSGKECVPVTRCGCVNSDGDYHMAGDVWYTTGCKEKCTCQGLDIIRCENHTCREQESCGLKDGIYGCHALERESCSASGDPHYTTFDKATFHFMGTCTYTLTKVCGPSSDLPVFSVATSNEHRGSNKFVSYVKAVHVDVYGQNVTLMKSRRVILNGMRMNLPVLIGDQLAIRLSGTFVLLETDFGLWVRYDGVHHVDVSVPSSYAGLLCGLGGNYNGNRTDDNLKPDGNVASSVTELGQSWVVEETPECTHNGGLNQTCDPQIIEEAIQHNSCGLIKDPQGIFKACHEKLPPEHYFENCVYDQCGTNGDLPSLCFSLQSYADLCAQKGVTNIPWRNNTFCPLNCPPGSKYTPCGTACPATCTDRSAPNSCNLPCVEGCVCDEGLILSGDKCVLFGQCGCTDQDKKYHLIGESWFTDNNCTTQCTCSSANNITCQEWQCSPVEVCKVQDGLLGCLTTGVAACHVAGDPHYFTFDNFMHTFMGTCTYTLVKVSDPSQVTQFTIVAKNEERGQPLLSYIRLAHIDIRGTRITLMKSKRVLIDDERVRLPANDRIPGVSIASSGIYTVVETDFGLVVKFDGNHHLEIQIPGSYYGKVSGMCGNYNAKDSDELMMPNGAQANNVTQFGNSWKAEGDSDPGCQPDTREDLNPSCTPGEKAQMEAMCKEMLSAPFQSCHNTIDPASFVQNCIYDMCEYQGMTSTLCDNIQSYVEACRSQGVEIKWRTITFCPLPCPPNSQYSACTSPCPSTCFNLYAASTCDRPNSCVEGCECTRGHVLSDDQCVLMKDCGCVDGPSDYHNVGDSWLTGNCTASCTCKADGLYCDMFQCPPHSGCSKNPYGTRICKPEKFDKCTISGDPHYRTFDNFVHHFQGKYTYTLVKTFNLKNRLETLNIEGRNKYRLLNTRVSLLRELHVEVFGFVVQMLEGMKLVVNGQKITPPYEPREGFRLYQRAKKIYLDTSFGLSITFDGKDYAEIVLPSTYRSQVRGLCGNYDGNSRNDYILPDGTVVNGLNNFGNSWRVKEQSRASEQLARIETHHVHRREVEDPESGFETSECTEDQLQAMNGTLSCGAISDPQGPFRDCHAIVAPYEYQENCVFDLCALFNDTGLKCLSYEAYVDSCQEAGVQMRGWRASTGCAMTCPANSTYKPCMSACPATCANLAAPSECSDPCMEGCECDKGYVLSGSKCVPFKECGAVYNSRYYQMNETFYDTGCASLCTCTNTGVVSCAPSACTVNEICTTYNENLGCYRSSPCLNAPCLNGGTCSEIQSGGYSCVCDQGYTGETCESDLPDLSQNPSPSPSPNPSPSPSPNPSPSPSHSPPDENTVNLVAILVGVLVPVAVIFLAIIGVCIYRRRISMKIWNTEKMKLHRPNKDEEHYDNAAGPSETITHF